MRPHRGGILRICHFDAIAVKPEAMNSCALWLGKTGRNEETYRPLYGRPVDIGNDSA